MKSEQRQLKKMNNFIQNQKKSVDQFFESQRACVSDIYQISSLEEKQERSVQQLEALFRQKKLFSTKSPEYTEILSHILIETEILRAINHEMQEYLKLLNEKTGVQIRISGHMIETKKKIDKILPPFK